MCETEQTADYTVTVYSAHSVTVCNEAERMWLHRGIVMAAIHHEVVTLNIEDYEHDSRG